MPAQTLNRTAAQPGAPKFLNQPKVDPVGAVTGALGAASTIAYVAPMAGGILGFIGNFIKPLQKLVNPVVEVATLPNVAAENLTQEVGKVFGSSHAITSTVEKFTSPVASFAQKTLGSHCDTLKSRSVGNLVMSASMTVGGTVALAKGMGGKLDAVKHMHKELTGKDISSMSILMGSKELHPVAAQARKELFSPAALFASAAEAGGIAFGLFNLFSKKDSGMLANLVMYAGVPLAANAAAGGHTACRSYMQAHKIAASGQAVPAEVYMEMVTGLVPAITPQASEDFALHCAQNHFTPEEALKTIALNFYPESSVGKATQRLNQEKTTSQHRQMAVAS